MTGEGLDRGDDRQHRAIQIQGVVADDVEQKQHHQNRPQPTGGLLHRRHRFGAFRGRENGHRTEGERQDRAQRRAQISREKRTGNADIGRQVTRIIRDIRREADLPDDPQRHRGQPAGQVETAAGEEIRRQIMGEDVEEPGEQRTAHDPGADAVERVNEAVADHADRGGAEGADQDAGRHWH
ncbi:hypothetical protein D3C71_1347020 [compost metagenome]